MKKKSTQKIIPTRTPEFEFFVKTDLRRYQGKYVALVGKRVVASGTDARRVWQIARKKHPAALPTLAKLPKEEMLVLV